MSIAMLQMKIGVVADGRPGPVTAKALSSYLLDGRVPLTDDDVDQCRDYLKAQRPHGPFMQKTLIAKMKDAPPPKGRLAWNDGGEWKLRNLRSIQIPFVGKRTVFSPGIPAFILAFTEVEILLPGFLNSKKMETLCTRRMNWSFGSLPSLHSFGLAFDIDLDFDGKLERIENLDENSHKFIKIMESWGFHWLKNDHMHFQWSR